MTPTPLTDTIVITVIGADGGGGNLENPNNYRVIGDSNGQIPIESATFEDVPGAEDTITLKFFEPLPDDRFSVTVANAIVDRAGNVLSAGAQIGRFTVDSRPEIGVWAVGNAWIDTNGNFVFEVAEGFEIEGGEVGRPLRGATIAGNGPEALLSIDMVASDLGYSLGTCGKDSQGVPVADAQPTLRIPELVVGGRADG